MKPVFVPRSAEEKAAQRALLQYFKPQNQKIVRESLKKIGRHDLIGVKEGCLVKPEVVGKTGGKIVGREKYKK